MGAYDFNIPKYNVGNVIEKLREELHNIVINSETSIDKIKQQLVNDERLLKELKNTVDNLPDYTEQYNEILVTLDALKMKIDEMEANPISLGYIQIQIEDD